MSTVQQDTGVDRVYALMAQQRRLLEKLESVLHYLGGVCVGQWLPGSNRTFDEPVKKVNLTGSRPCFVVCEVQDDGRLSFTGSIPRAFDCRRAMRFSTAFAYDITMPFARRGGPAGLSLPANNVVLAGRAVAFLQRLLGVGRAIGFNTDAGISQPRFPLPVFNRRGVVVEEDYTPVLGLEIENPTAGIRSVPIRLPNPTSAILARRGLNDVTDSNYQTLLELVAEFRAAFPGYDIPPDTIANAFNSSPAYFEFQAEFETALTLSPLSVVGAVRAALPLKYMLDASYSDLLRAAHHPDQPVRISRLSAMQVFSADEAQELPAGYCGNVLAPVNWAPRGQSEQMHFAGE